MADILTNKHLFNVSREKIRIASYDINVNQFPNGIDFRPEFPQVYFFPAYTKQFPFRKFEGQIEAATVLKFVLMQNDIVKMKSITNVELNNDNDIYNYVNLYRHFKAKNVDLAELN